MKKLLVIGLIFLLGVDSGKFSYLESVRKAIAGKKNIVDRNFDRASFGGKPNEKENHTTDTDFLARMIELENEKKSEMLIHDWGRVHKRISRNGKAKTRFKEEDFTDM